MKTLQTILIVLCMITFLGCGLQNVNECQTDVLIKRSVDDPFAFMIVQETEEVTNFVTHVPVLLDVGGHWFDIEEGKYTLVIWPDVNIPEAFQKFPVKAVACKETVWEYSGDKVWVHEPFTHKKDFNLHKMPTLFGN